MPAPIHSYRNHVRRLWRWVFVFYTLLLFISTHWPRLKLPPAAPSDKSIHLFAFAGLTFLLWQTRWIRSRLLLLLVVAAWGTIDELSQSLPILGRTVSVEDALANLLGVVCSVAVLWSLAPVGGVANRLRLSLHLHVFESIFARLHPWFVMGGLCAACALPLAIVWRMLQPTGMTGPILIALAVWLMAAWVLLRNWWRAELLHIRAEQPCFACGDRSPRAFDTFGTSVCPRCLITLYAAQWRDPPPPSGRDISHMGLLPLLLGGMLLLAVFGSMLAIAIAARITIGGAPVQRFLPYVMQTLSGSRTLAHMFDLTLCVLLFASLTRIYRTRLARHYDQANRCKSCGHDLRGTPTTDGRGVCGECGTEFFVTLASEERASGLLSQQAPSVPAGPTADS